MSQPDQVGSAASSPGPHANLFAIGSRVVLRGNHGYGGRLGTIINSPGRVFNGWNVRLDDGHCVGAADHQMRLARDV